MDKLNLLANKIMSLADSLREVGDLPLNDRAVIDVIANYFADQAPFSYAPQTGANTSGALILPLYDVDTSISMYFMYMTKPGVAPNNIYGYIHNHEILVAYTIYLGLTPGTVMDQVRFYKIGNHSTLQDRKHVIRGAESGFRLLFACNANFGKPLSTTATFNSLLPSMVKSAMNRHVDS